MIKTNFIVMSHYALSAYTKICRPVCHQYDISQTSLDILVFLADHNELNTAKDICMNTGIKKNLVSMNVEKLVAGEFLKRENDPLDRRVVHLIVTEKAQPVIERGREIKKYFKEAFIKNIDEEDYKIYRKCVEKITDNIEELYNSINKKEDIFN